MKAHFKRYLLDFKTPAGTSRGTITEKETWFVFLEDENRRGVGECGLLRSLSVDDRPDYEDALKYACSNISKGEDALLADLKEFPSIQFGLETAFRSLESVDPFILFPSDFTEGAKAIPINGLIWMGDRQYMLRQIEEKLKQGFACVKLKIGALGFDTELDLIGFIREKFSADQVEIRVDANGGFSSDDALNKLTQLSGYKLHSIEQPIKTNQHDIMSKLAKGPLPVALDEELIGVFERKEKQRLLETVMPQYIVLKPSLVGGFRGTKEWIDVAEQLNIGWWITSALESNVGLNAIAQWTFIQNVSILQGLGTGSLYTNNFESPLIAEKGFLRYDPTRAWKFDL